MHEEAKSENDHDHEPHYVEKKTYETENGNKYIRYYPEGDNNALQKHNGATRRAIEARASITAAAKIGATYAPKDPDFSEWLKNPGTHPEIEKKMKIQFIKDCESLAQLPERELAQLRESDSLALQNGSNRKIRNAFYKSAIEEHIEYSR